MALPLARAAAVSTGFSERVPPTESHVCGRDALVRVEARSVEGDLVWVRVRVRARVGARATVRVGAGVGVRVRVRVRVRVGVGVGVGVRVRVRVS